MKLSFSLFAAVLFIISNISTNAQIVLAPGETKIFTNEPATGGEVGDNGNFIQFNLNSAYDVSSKTLKAESISNPASFFGTGYAYSLIYYDFGISETPGTENNTVGGWINYNVFWQGYQEILATLGSNSYVNVEMYLIDFNLNQVVMHETIHDLDLKTHSFKITVGGFNFNDTDTKTNTIPVVFVRGHGYRLHLKLTATLFVTTPSIINSACDYMDGILGGGDGRVELTNLFVKVGLDEQETLQKLAKLDSLETRIDTLEYKLDHHYHIYLTGRGAGHNNTEANTTLSIFEEESLPNIYPPQYETQPDLNSDESEMDNSTPEEFSLGQNYPNPFNPNTKISFDIPVQEFVTIKVYDILGRQVKSLVNETKSPGYYKINFNAEKLPSGTYIYEIRAGNFVETKKMVLLK